MKTVVLHGRFRKLFPDGIKIDARTPAEAINLVTRQIKELRPVPGRPRHCFKVLGFETAESLITPTDKTEIHLVPDFSGGKDVGFVQIVIGAVLIAAAFWNPYSLLSSVQLFETVTLQSLVFGIGASMTLGGLISLLSPAPLRDMTAGPADPEASKYLGAPRNTVAIGTRIPIGVGEHILYGHYLSFDIKAVDVAV